MARLKKLTPHAKECKEICEAEGLEVLSWDSGRNCHYKFRVRRKDGAEMTVVTAATAGDRRALDNHRSVVRRFARAIERLRSNAKAKPRREAASA